MASRPGSHTAVMSDFFNVCTGAAFALSLTSTGTNSSRMLRSLNRLKSPTLKPFYWSTSSNGLVTYPEWSAQGGLYGELSTGNSDRGALKKRYKDCLKKSLNVWHVECLQWSDMAAHRDAWRHTVHKAASQFEENRRDSLKDRRQRRKAQAASTTKKRRPDLHVPTLHEDLPVSQRPPLSRTGLQSAWTTTLLIFVREAKPNNNSCRCHC